MSTIFNFSEAVFIAVHCCALLSESGRKMNGAELAVGVDASENHINKVMQKLARQGFVRSFRGPHGGYSISFDPCEISLLELYEAVEGKLKPASCPFGKQNCPFSECCLGSKVSALGQEFVQFLKNTKMESLVRGIDEKKDNQH